MKYYFGRKFLVNANLYIQAQSEYNGVFFRIIHTDRLKMGNDTKYQLAFD